MPDNKDFSPEEFYRDIVVQGLKDLVEGQKDTNQHVSEILDRLKTIEIVVVGVDGKNCLMSRVEILEKHTDSLRTFKTKVIAIVAVIQAVAALLFAAAVRLIR